MSTTLEPRSTATFPRRQMFIRSSTTGRTKRTRPFSTASSRRPSRTRQSSDIYARLADVEDRHVESGPTAGGARHPPGPFRPSGRARLLASSAVGSGRDFCCRCCSQRKGARSRRTSTCIARRRAARRRRREALTLARESAEHATTLAGIAGQERRALAQDGVRRISAQRRVRLQRRPDRELRPRRRRDRRDGGAAAPGGGRRRRRGPDRRRAVDGLERIPRRARASARSTSTRSRWSTTKIALMPEIERDELALIYEAKGMDRDAGATRWRRR